MPVIICPNCKHRMLAVNPTCPSCGYGLSPSPFTSVVAASRVPSSALTPSPLPPTPSVPPTPISVVPAGGTSVAYPPNILEGVIVDPPSTREFFDTIGGRLSNDPETRIYETSIRIKRSDGTMRGARIEGILRGASLSQGDQVTLNGEDRDGTFIVTSGYNHTIHGKIIVEQERELFFVSGLFKLFGRG